MKSTIYWDITPYNPLKVNRRFGGTYGLHLHGRRISWLKTSVKAGDKQSYLLSRRFAARLILWTWRWSRYIPPKRWFPFSGIHGFISQKIIFFSTVWFTFQNIWEELLYMVVWSLFLKERKWLEFVQKVLRDILWPSTQSDGLTTWTEWWRERSVVDKDHLSCYYSLVIYFSSNCSREFVMCQTGSLDGRNMKRVKNVDGKISWKENTWKLHFL
jgi:hypothetical protein